MSRETQVARLLRRGGDRIVEINGVQIQPTARQHHRAIQLSDHIESLECQLDVLRAEEAELNEVAKLCYFNQSEIERLCSLPN